MLLNTRPVVGAAAVIVSLLILGFLYSQDRSTVGLHRGKMPACDSATTRSLLTKSFAESPNARREGLELIKIGDLRDPLLAPDQANADPAAEQRICFATAFTNAGKDTITIRLSWMNAQKTEIWLESE
jgi:hypothetical protein